MLVKASVAATALIFAAVGLSSIDLRQLYNEMYPVNGLRRDVLTLCHQAEPTFIRAVKVDRVGCYDSMPDPVELAIGWVRTSSRLAAMRQPTPVEVAERLLVAAISERRLDRLGPPQFTGYALVTGGAARACDGAKSPVAVASAPALPDDRLVLHAVRGDGAALAALGLMPHRLRLAASRRPELPILSLGGAGGGSGTPEAANGIAGLVDPAPAPDLGGDSAPLLAPAAAPSLCRTPA